MSEINKETPCVCRLKQEKDEQEQQQEEKEVAVGEQSNQSRCAGGWCAPGREN